MGKLLKALLLIFFLAKISVVSVFCQNRQGREDKIIDIINEGSPVKVKISYPENLVQMDKIIIWSTYPLASNFFPDSISKPQQTLPFLRNKLLENGYINIEYIGRKDSIEILGRKYLRADAQTKAADLNCLLNYIQADNTLKNKKIILIGHSEGGSINAQTAAERSSDIHAMVQLACVALSGKEIMEYQKETRIYNNMLLAVHSNQEYTDKTYNLFSSLDSYHKADLEGMRQFCKENIQPIEDIIYKFEDMDSIYYHVEQYLRNRWDQEDEEFRKSLEGNFEQYYKGFAISLSSTTPWQIAHRKYAPEKYYPYVKCPVLAVHGTEDKNVECYPNLENMERLLNQGGNHNFHKIILEGYDHDFVKSGRPVSTFVVEDAFFSEIVNWIEKQ